MTVLVHREPCEKEDPIFAVNVEAAETLGEDGAQAALKNF